MQQNVVEKVDIHQMTIATRQISQEHLESSHQTQGASAGESMLPEYLNLGLNLDFELLGETDLSAPFSFLGEQIWQFI